MSTENKAKPREFYLSRRKEDGGLTHICLHRYYAEHNPLVLVSKDDYQLLQSQLDDCKRKGEEWQGCAESLAVDNKNLTYQLEEKTAEIERLGSIVTEQAMKLHFGQCQNCEPVYCCNGMDCGCYAMPVEFKITDKCGDNCGNKNMLADAKLRAEVERLKENEIRDGTSIDGLASAGDELLRENSKLRAELEAAKAEIKNCQYNHRSEVEQVKHLYSVLEAENTRLRKKIEKHLDLNGDQFCACGGDDCELVEALKQEGEG